MCVCVCVCIREIISPSPKRRESAHPSSVSNIRCFSALSPFYVVGLRNGIKTKKNHCDNLNGDLVC